MENREIQNRLDSENYIYSSTRLRAASRGGFSKAVCGVLAEAKSGEELKRALEERGLPLTDDTEACLSRYLKEGYDLVADIVPDAALYALLRYPYDCHNLKAAVKNEMRPMGALTDLLTDMGTVPASDIAAMAQRADFRQALSSLPPHLRDAVGEAEETYLKTGDPQWIDAVLDRACFADMAEAAEAGGCAYLKRYVTVLADTTDIITALRVIRLGRDGDYYRRMAVPGGQLREDLFEEVFAAETDREALLWEKLRVTDYRSVALQAETVGEQIPVTLLTRLCEEIRVRQAKEASGVLYGPEVPAYYLILREQEVRNLRILIASVKAGIPAEAIRDKLRPTCE